MSLVLVILCMQRLKIILQSNIFYILLFAICFLYVLFLTKIIKYQSIYESENVNISGVVTHLSRKNGNVSFEIKEKENVKVNYYKEDGNLKEGMYVTLVGVLKNPKNNTVPNAFNYKNYLYNKRIYKILTLTNYHINRDENILYKIKNKLKAVMDKDEKSSVYLKLFITGNKDDLESDLYELYKSNGIAHLLAISGMHISLFILILKKVLKKFSINAQFVITILFLFFYVFLTGFTVSILRCFIFYLLSFINSRAKFGISNLKLLFLTAFILIFINPFYFYDIGFRYSIIITFGIMLSKEIITGTKIKQLFLVSLISFLFSLPITVNLNYEINIMSLLVNMFMVPFVSYIFYPLTLFTLLFSVLLPIHHFFINVFEYLNWLLNKMAFNIIIPKMSLLFVFFYYLFLIFFIKTKYKKIFLSVLILLLIINNVVPKINTNFKVIFLDVGQGDSTLIISPHNKTVSLIDTGGKINSDYKVSKNTILYLKSLGITRIDNIILTHGDFDHMGDAEYIVNNFKVGQVIFNCGEFNNLEKNLIGVLNNKKIKYNACIKELNINENELHFLNTKEYNNENDNSSVIYFNYGNYRFLFMGDAGVKREKDILEKYNLGMIDFLKVGHHGSDTSSSKYFINKINPRYSLISVGENNRYGHPKESVLDTLSNSNIYRTDLDGSIEIELNKNKYNINIYS